MVAYEERVNANIVHAILGDDFNPALHYYMYHTITDVTMRAVDPVTNENCWKESIKIDTEEAKIKDTYKVTCAHSGHWFYTYLYDGKPKKQHRLLVLFVLLLLCCAALIFLGYNGGHL